MKSLYFVAALTRLDIEHNIWNMKDEVAKATGSVRGLKVLPHITMMYPFKFSSAEEDNIIRQLSALISTFTPLELHFAGFDYFQNPRSHTLYVKVDDHPLLQEQHRMLSLYGRDRLRLPPTHTPLRFTPHMTIAYRDLDKPKFDLAWSTYRNRTFDERMTLESLWLLKHDGLCRIPCKKFIFKGFKTTLF